MGCDKMYVNNGTGALKKVLVSKLILMWETLLKQKKF